MNTLSEITLFRNYFNPDPVANITVLTFMGLICKPLEGPLPEILELRSPETSPERKKEIKASLPAFTISGTFKERKLSGLIQHSGFICLDFDGKENPNIKDWPRFRDQLIKIDNVLFSALSVSGQGVFCLVPLAHPERHNEQFKALEGDFKALGFRIDPACKDVSRLRVISYDPGAGYNPNAKPYTKIFRIPQQKPVFKGNSNDFDQLIRAIVSAGIDITDNYRNWFEIGCCLANEKGESGRGSFHDISKANPAYNPAECDKQFNYCLKSPYKYSKSTLFYLADQYGIRIKY